MRSACVTILLLGLLLAQKANATNVTLCFSLSVSDASYEPEFYGCAQTDNYCRGGPNSFDFTSPTERAMVTWKYPTSCEGHGMVCSTAWEFYPSDNTLAIYLAGDDRYTCSLTGVSSNYYKYDCEGRSASVSFFNS